MRLGIDTGGTYTDAVLFDERRGVIAAAKALTTRADLAIGIGEATGAVLAASAGDRGAIRLVSISTTLATNALVEGHGRAVCLLLVGQKPAVLHRWRLSQALGDDPVAFIDGGHAATGEALCPLDLDAARRAIAEQAPRVAAFAIVSQFSVRNAEHENMLRRLVRDMTELPVTCSHELTCGLNAPRRALTSVLNARLVALIQNLIDGVQATLAEQRIEAPLMVVKGDGSLVTAARALERPVETILSGPAASIVGAHFLSGEDDVVVADMGGTTTDIAIMDAGRPALSDDGARVGEWSTMVQAVAVHSVGLGGDSEVRLEAQGRLSVGPERALPLALLARQHPRTIALLRRQLESPAPAAPARFVLRHPRADAVASSLTAAERRLWQALGDEPTPLERLLREPRALWALQRLRRRECVVVAGLTPSDAAHALGRHHEWCTEAARLGAAVWLKAHPELGHGNVEALCDAIVDTVVQQCVAAVVSTALDDEEGSGGGAQREARRYLLEKALRRRAPRLGVSLRLHSPLVAVGAPAHLYCPEVARRLDTRVVIPDHAEVANAVGAVAGRVVQRADALITPLPDQRFRVHVASGNRDFDTLDRAGTYAEAETSRLARGLAAAAGSDDVEVHVERADSTARVDSAEMFIESRITALAAGPPRWGWESRSQSGGIGD